MRKVDLDQFVMGERRRLEAFRRWWRREHFQSPDEFPLEMLPGEWDEQLLIFDEPKEDPRGTQATTVNIREDQHFRLKELSRRTGVPMAEYIRQGVTAVLEREGFGRS